MSKEYTYLEAIREIFIDKGKRFKEEKGEIMFFNKGTGSLNIRVGTGTIEELIINDNWINSKWTLVEEKKNYNVRVYNISNSRLISSENVTMTEEEIKIHCNSKIVLGDIENILDGRNNILFTIKNINKTKVVCEEITT